jgi:hypothetical protein
MTKHWTYRRDRWGEPWHIVPVGEHGLRGRALCGEPRQGTPLSESHANTQPRPPQCLCSRCEQSAPGQGIPVRRP